MSATLQREHWNGQPRLKIKNRDYTQKMRDRHELFAEPSAEARRSRAPMRPALLLG